MSQRYDLSSLSWTLTGWHPHSWARAVSMELGTALNADVSAVPARVPGSVLQALRDAGLVPDWNVKLNSRDCEWVENRDWIYETKLPVEWTSQSGKKILHCAGLDYQGVLLLNGKQIADFRGTFIPHEFDLTPHLCEGENRLALVLTEIPRYLGQINYTSRITEWKARFNYVWDWTPRIVQKGIWDDLCLEVRGTDAIKDLSAYSTYNHASGLGGLTLRGLLTCQKVKRVEVVVEGAEGEIARKAFPMGARFSAQLHDLTVAPWHPNGNGTRALYRVTVRMRTYDGEILDEQTLSIGFKDVVWKPCAGAPADALPWICSVNGIDTFLQGANWVPVRPNFADVTEADYRKLLELYAQLGFNLLRVWGGAVLEKEPFYRICDELGIMVWQEFPLSSSGSDNWPPEEPKAIEEMREIVTSYVNRRQHHPSLLLWCGGNELQGDLFDGGKYGFCLPVDTTHPMIGMMEQVIAILDTTRHFLPTSSSGPRFIANEDEFGLGVHHDVHGPWDCKGPLEKHFAYWDQDDALLRSETGMPGASSVALIRQYGEEMAMPANLANPFYKHTQGWWIQWEDYLAEGGDPDSLEAYVAWSQLRQARGIRYAAATCKKRFPACGGIIIWMGHDCYPCPLNTALIDFNAEPKPAALAISEVFHATPAQAAEMADEMRGVTV